MATSIVLQPDAAVIGGELVRDATIRVEGGRIASIAVGEPAADGRRIGGTLLPGLIDLQCNGAGGHSVDETTPEALATIARQVAHGGATAFLPTLITAPWEALVERVAAVASWISTAPTEGAEPLGIHVEGPFLDGPGVHDPHCFLDATPERIDALVAAAGGHLALVTLSPGRAGAAQAVARFREHGVAVALGHTQTADGTPDCVAAGARLVTHLFNAMGPLHHREPGLAGLALDDERLSCTVIPDGFHVHEVMLRNAYRCLGPERTILVTDSVAAAGMPDGEFALCGQPVTLSQGVVRDPHGALAGSALTMSQAAVRWLRMVPMATPAALAATAASNPARILGRSDRGEIAEGLAARFCVLEGNTVRVLDL